MILSPLRRSVTAAALAALAALSFAAPASAEDSVQITSVDIDAAAEPPGSMEISVQSPDAASVDPATQIVLSENGLPIAATVTRVPSEGLEVVLLMDTSGSMREGDAITAAKEAAIGFLDALPPEVAVGVVSFADQPSLVSPLTRDRNALRNAISRLQATGETALYDAVVFGESLFSGGTLDRQMLVLSDGGDTVSLNPLENAVAVATRIRTSVIELPSSEANRDALLALVGANGGALSTADDPAALAELYQQAATSLVNRFQLAFTPVARGDATYSVQVVTPDGTLEASTVTTVDLPPATTTPPPTTAPPATTVPATLPPVTPDDSATSGIGSGTLRLSGAGLLFLGILGLGVLAMPSARRDRATGNLRRLVPVRKQGTPAQKRSISDRASDAAERVLDRSDRGSNLAQLLESAGLSLRPGEFVVFSLLGGAFVLLLAIALTNVFLGVLITAVFVPMVARSYLSSRVEKRQRMFEDQLPDVLQMMVSSLRAGFGLPQALDAAATQAPDPARSELQRVLFEVRVGRDVNEALQATADRMNSKDFGWVVSAMQINREVGGELAQVLENVANTVRERQQLRRQIQVLTAEGRFSANILIALPFVVGFGMWLNQRDYFEVLGDPPGPFIIVLSAVLLLVGWLWIRRLVKSVGY